MGHRNPISVTIMLVHPLPVGFVPRSAALPGPIRAISQSSSPSRCAPHQLRGRCDRLYPRQQRPLLDAGRAGLDGADAVEGPDRRKDHGRPRSMPRLRPISPRSTPITTPGRFRSTRPTTPARAMGSTIEVNGSGAVTTEFMKVAGFPNINFNTVRPRRGAMCGCAWRWRSTSPARWRDDGKMAGDADRPPRA